MRITSIGGGPGGLYAAILMKKADPRRAVTVYERNAPDDTFGFGVVFSAATLAELEDADAPTYEAIMRACARWDPVDIHYAGQVVRARGNRFAAISRKRLLQILQDRAAQLDVRLEFRTPADPERVEADLVVGADGVNSAVRARFAASFRPSVTVEGGKFIWLGTTKPLEAFTFIFKDSEHGRFQVHAYPYDEQTSTWIVECDEASWRKAGLDSGDSASLPPGASDEEAIRYCAELFADDLAGHELVANNSKWIDWQTVRNRSWRHGNVVLLGDAAHTAHFSIGSGTKLAMEDAIALSASLDRHADLDDALADYEAERRPVVERWQDVAAESMDWFARYTRYLRFPPPQFAYSLLTRSGRVTYDNLKVRDPRLLYGFERWFAAQAATDRRAHVKLVASPPAATPLRLRDADFANRVVVTVPPAFAATAGSPSLAAQQRMRRLARCGAALLLVELVAVSEWARVTPADLGCYDDAHLAWLQDLCAAAHEAGTLVGLQLVHAGPRGATRPRTRASDAPLRADQAWPLVAASAVPYTGRSQTPEALDAAGMRTIGDDFAEACRLADRAGVDLVEIHIGHGYLLASFLSPLTNRRVDDHGGPLAHRLRFPLAVVTAARRSWPGHKPLSVCLSASDLAPGGLSDADAVEAARLLAQAGADVFDVVAGQTVRDFSPDYDQGYHAPWADLVRNTAEVPTIASGNLPTVWAINDVLAAGKADLCILGRPLLAEPEWLGTHDRRSSR